MVNLQGYSTPARSYFIGMTPRSGSTLLCELLSGTGNAGRPAEHFWNFDGVDYATKYNVASNSAALARIVEAGSTANGVFAAKLGFDGPFFPGVVTLLRDGLRLPPDLGTYDVIGQAFPGLRVIWMTRRNKVRQAVSWWRAIQSDVWHLRASTDASTSQNGPEYDFDAINALVQELILREAAHHDFLNELPAPPPMTVVYEDLIRDMDGTVRRVLEYLDLPVPSVSVHAPELQRISDNLNEEWVERFKEEKQRDLKVRHWLYMQGGSDRPVRC